MAGRDTLRLPQALDLIVQDGSEDEREVDHYESCNESADEEDFVHDVPEKYETVECPEYFGDEDQDEILNDDHEVSSVAEVTRSSDTTVDIEINLEDNILVEIDRADPSNVSDEEDETDADDITDTHTEEESGIDEFEDETVWVGHVRRDFPHLPRFTARSGLQPGVFRRTSAPTPLDAFRVFITDEFLQKVKEETNKYARAAIEENMQQMNGSPKSVRMVFTDWSPVTVADLRNFFACCIHMGIVKMPNLSDYWSAHPAVHTSYCGQLMSQNRFTDIMMFLHISDNSTYIPFGEDHHDPLHKIRPFLTHLNERFQEVYVPEQGICVGDSLCPYKGRSRFKVYLKDKPGNWGFKFYELRESSSGYLYRFEMFCADQRVSNQPYDVTMRLIEPLLNKGYHLYMNNYFCCPEIARDLALRGTGVCGTVRRDKVGMPVDLAEGTLEQGGVDFRRRGPVVACCWKDRKDIFTLSTLHQPSLRLTQGRNTLKEKPLAVISYINHVAEADHCKELIKSYLPMEHAKCKWWKKPFFYLLTLVITQSMIILNKQRQSQGQRQLGMEEMVKAILTSLPEEEKIPHTIVSNKDRLTGRHFLSRIPSGIRKEKPYRNCKVCYARARDKRASSGRTARNKRKQTRFLCPECDVALCVVPCFKIWHTAKDVVKD